MLLENFMFQKLLRLVSTAGWLTPSFESFPQLCLLFSPPLHHHKMFKYEWLITKRQTVGQDPTQNTCYPLGQHLSWDSSRHKLHCTVGEVWGHISSDKRFDRKKTQG